MTKPSDPPVYFHFDNIAFSLRNRKKLKYFITQMFKDNKRKVAVLNYVFSTDRQVLKINREYLNHDFYTDVIAFDLSGSRLKLEGEIYISVDRIRQNAKTFGVPFYEELYRVIFHGTLHLCGYRDKSSAEKKEMRQKEAFYLARYLKN